MSRSRPRSARPTTGLRIVWNASPDDLGVLAAWLGVNAGSLTVIEDGELVPDESSRASGGCGWPGLARSPTTCSSGSRSRRTSRCSGSLLPVDDVEATGATLDFDCGGPVPAADVRIATLTDVDEAYRTLASGPSDRARPTSSDTGAVTWALTSADAVRRRRGTTPTAPGAPRSSSAAPASGRRARRGRDAGGRRRRPRPDRLGVTHRSRQSWMGSGVITGQRVPE